MGILKKLLTLVTGEQYVEQIPVGKYTERQLIQKESHIGRELFGPIPSDHRREFFCLDAHTWVWHEEWIDIETGQRRTMTTRYEVHENGILKVMNSTYKFLEGQELQNFYQAVKIYYERNMREVYLKDPYTRQPLVPAL